jgi:signal transduction histidine kinase
MGMETELFPEGNGIGTVVLGGIFLMALMGMVLLLFFYFSKKKITQKELEKKNLEIAHQKNLLEATLEAQEKERQRIAQDLHDDISSKLNIVSLNCDMLLTGDLAQNEQQEALGNIVGLSAKALESSRHIAHGLFPPVLDKFGLDAGIAELCGEFRGNGLQVNYENHTSFEEAEKSRHLHVFRILQELMNNSVRHGKATNIEVSFEQEDGKKICKYQDDGIGFDMENNKNQKGLGMKNIQSRVDFLGGELFIDSKTNQGTTVTFDF